MALGTLHSHAKKDLRRGLGQRFGPLEGDEVVGRAVVVGVAAGGDQLAHEPVHGLVLAERVFQPVVHRPHALLAERGAVGFHQVGPLERPERRILVDVHVLCRIAGEAEQPIDQLCPLGSIRGGDEDRHLLRRRQRADGIEISPANERGIVAQRRGGDADLLEAGAGQAVDEVLIGPVRQIDRLGVGHDKLGDDRAAFEADHRRADASADGLDDSLRRDAAARLRRCCRTWPRQ